jgi:hypothetical protein
MLLAFVAKQRQLFEFRPEVMDNKVSSSVARSPFEVENEEQVN